MTLNTRLKFPIYIYIRFTGGGNDIVQSLFIQINERWCYVLYTNGSFVFQFSKFYLEIILEMVYTFAAIKQGCQN